MIFNPQKHLEEKTKGALWEKLPDPRILGIIFFLEK